MPVRRRDRRRCHRYDFAARTRQAQSRDQVASCRRSLAADDAETPLRLRAFLDASPAGRLGDCQTGRREDRDGADQAGAETVAARRCCGAFGLRQGRADAEADPRGDRAREKARQAGRGRSQGHRFLDLSRRDHRHAEPEGTGRRDASAGGYRQRDRSGSQSVGRHDWQQGGAGDAERRGHVALYALERGGPRAGLSGEGARRLRRG